MSRSMWTWPLMMNTFMTMEKEDDILFIPEIEDLLRSLGNLRRWPRSSNLLD